MSVPANPQADAACGTYALAPSTTENDRATKGSSLEPRMRPDYGPWVGDVLASSAESMVDVVLSDMR